ncbi:SOUL heme-binding family protein [Perilla frutescens var. hirtella]|uniref:SOUL heme-binding family protein n=1 Tax=Perilla frutescens var. hirtella TaxID=608512 RepID=A0AAD4IQ60_PERFH|nr:SOUL heme-binding family protein [Perilla frutescens var. hirtella]
MAGAFELLKLCFLVSGFLFRSSVTAANEGGSGVGVFPATCASIECPSYDVVDNGKGFEIRRYNSSMWISTQPIDDFSLVDAGNIAFFQLFDYIQGKNDQHEKIEMTAPVIIEVKPSDGPFCASSFIVSFYIPKENQATAPSSESLWVQKWGVTYVAVRQFSGFVKDDDVAEEAAALYASIAGTVWSEAIDKSHEGGGSTTEYIVAQYNSPFEFRNRVNEIWLTFNLEGGNFLI